MNPDPDYDADDAALDRIEDGLPPRTPEEAALMARYEDIRRRICALGDLAWPPGAAERAFARFKASDPTQPSS